MLPPLLGRDVFDLARRRAAGIVHQHVEPAEVSGRFFDDGGAVFGPGHVAGKQQNAAAERLRLVAAAHRPAAPRLRATTATSAPRRARSRTIAAPMPSVPPVIRATLPVRSMV